MNICPSLKKFSGKFLSILILFLTISLIRTNIAEAAPCGNGVCQPSQNENQTTCPADCGVVATPTPTPIPVPTPTPTPVPNPTPTPTSVPNPTPTPTLAPGQTPTPTPVSEGSSGSSSNSSSSSSSSTSDSSYSSPTLNSGYSAPTNNSSPTFSGTVSVGQGTISQVEYTTDGGNTWNQAQPTDGSFNSSTEGYIFTISNIGEGTHTIQIRSKNSEGVYSKSEQYATTSVTIATTPPTIIFDKITPNPAKEPPLISVKANSKYAKILYSEVSIDGGRTWQRMNSNGIGFSLKLNKLEDGNYPVIIRAIDSAGNIGRSGIQTLIIDTIPPIIGGSLQSLGPQVLKSSTNGVVNLVAGTKSSFAISMKGGVIKASVKTPDESFELKQQPGTSIWLGNIQFNSKGEKEITISAIDGANNKTERTINLIEVKDFGHALNAETKNPVKDVKVSLYYFQKFSRKWLLWNADVFGQKNPQITNDKGEYSFMVPQGKYYIEAKSPTFHTIQSEIINVDESTIINFALNLHSKPSLKLNLPVIGKRYLSFPTIIPNTEKVPSFNSESPETNNKYLLSKGEKAPEISLLDLNNKKNNISKYKGKKMLLTFFSPWSSPSLEQMSILSDLKSNSSEEVIVAVALQESIPTIDTFMKRGNYKFQVLIDPNGETAAKYKISLLPQHYFIDKNGIIRDAFVGVLAEQTILEKFKIMQ